MDEKIITYLEKTGQGEVAKLLQNSIDKFPDEFDPEKSASDFLDSRNAIYKSSDDHKNYGKEQRIIGEKETNKQWNIDLGLGLTNAEAEKLGRDGMIKLAKEKEELKLKDAQNGHTKEINEKYNTAVSESTKLKKMLEDTETNYKKQLEEANGKYDARVKQEGLDKVLNEEFDKIEWTDKEVAKVYTLTKIKENEIKWDEKGRPFKGENDVVTAPDGVTRLNDLGSVLKTFGKALISQANPGGQPPKPGQPNVNGQPPVTSGDPKLDAYLQQQTDRNNKLNATIK